MIKEPFKVNAMQKVIDKCGIIIFVDKDKVPGADKAPMFTVNARESVNDLNGRISRSLNFRVKTNVATDKKSGLINFDIRSLPFVFTVLNEMQKVLDLNTDAPSNVVFENKDYIFTSGEGGKRQRSEDRKVVSRLIFGRNKEGQYYISVISPDDSRPKIPFTFQPPYGMELYTEKGPLNPTESSKACAYGFLNAIERLIPNLFSMGDVEGEGPTNGTEDQVWGPDNLPF